MGASCNGEVGFTTPILPVGASDAVPAMSGV